MALFQVECSSEWSTAEPHGGFWVQSESSDVIVEDVLAKENKQNKAGEKGLTAWEETLYSEDSDNGFCLSLWVSVDSHGCFLHLQLIRNKLLSAYLTTSI